MYDSEKAYSWGRFPKVEHSRVLRLGSGEEIADRLATVPHNALPYGLGRSYGDSCLNENGELFICADLNHVIKFDVGTGLMRSEPGLSLAELLRIAVPFGWFLPVTPGTKYVTIGGAIANDVHGKNHHVAGTFGGHVKSLKLVTSTVGEIDCSAEKNPGLFRATIGGLGLTGVIRSVELQLKRVHGPWVAVEAHPFRSLNSFLALCAESDVLYEYTVAWLDCLASRPRGIFFRANHSDDRGSTPTTSPLTLHAVPPCNLLGGITSRLFNAAYYWRYTISKKPHKQSFDSFFYPLDRIDNWNMLYGSAGFVQHQSVIPESNISSLEEMLALVRKLNTSSSLAVLKRFGLKKSPGILSFPRPGITLALDLPMEGSRTFKLLNGLDEIVVAAGGALYPAKDARMSAATFQASFPHLMEFLPYVDPKLSSSFWRRVTESPACKGS